MAIKKIEETTLVQFANIIRSKLDTTEKIAPQDMADLIRSITVGDIPFSKISSGTIAFANGYYTEFTVTHNLGHPPDILVVSANNSSYQNTNTKLCYVILLPLSDSSQLALSYTFRYINDADSEDEWDGYIKIIPYNRFSTENSTVVDAMSRFYIGSTTYNKYNWIAIRL